MKRKDRTAEKRQPIPSGSAGTAPLRRAFRFGFQFWSFSWRVLVAAAHQRRRSRIKTSTRHGCKWLFRRSIWVAAFFCRRRVKMHLKLAASRWRLITTVNGQNLLNVSLVSDMRCLIVVMKFDIIKVHRIVFFTILIEVAQWQRQKNKKNRWKPHYGSRRIN